MVGINFRDSLKLNHMLYDWLEGSAKPTKDDATPSNTKRTKVRSFKLNMVSVTFRSGMNLNRELLAGHWHRHNTKYGYLGTFWLSSFFVVVSYGVGLFDLSSHLVVSKKPQIC